LPEARDYSIEAAKRLTKLLTLKMATAMFAEMFEYPQLSLQPRPEDRGQALGFGVPPLL
jgi:hypothetical protein